MKLKILSLINKSCFLYRVVQLWRENLGSVNNKAANSLADPEEYENLFPGFVEAQKTEQFLRPQRKSLIPANKYPQVPVSFYLLLIGGKMFVSIGLLSASLSPLLQIRTKDFSSMSCGLVFHVLLFQ